MDEIAARTLVMDFAFVSLALLLAALLRAKVAVLQRWLIPSNILAGLILLMLGSYFLDMLDFSADRMLVYAGHLLTAALIALGLRDTGGGRSRFGTASTAAVMGSGLLLQVAVGLAFVLLWVGALFPEFPAVFGLSMPFGLGGEQTLAMETGGYWQAENFQAGLTGVAFSVLGLVLAYVIGIVWINRGRKGRQLQAEVQEDHLLLAGAAASDREKGRELGRITTSPQSLDTLSLHLALIGIVFLVNYTLIDNLVSWIRRPGLEPADHLWLLSFVSGYLLAVLARRIIKGVKVDHLVEDGLLARVGGFCLDYLIAVSLASLPLIIFSFFLALPWIELLLLAGVGVLVTLGWVSFLSPRLHRDHVLERSVSVFAVLTGNFASGLALLKMMDPELRTPVARDLTCAAGWMLVLWTPLIFTGSFLAGFQQRGQPELAAGAALVIFTVLLLAVLAGWMFYRSRYRRDRSGGASAEAPATGNITR